MTWKLEASKAYEMCNIWNSNLNLLMLLIFFYAIQLMLLILFYAIRLILPPNIYLGKQYMQ